jgi:hypothetical protein
MKGISYPFLPDYPRLLNLATDFYPFLYVDSLEVVCDL